MKNTTMNTGAASLLPCPFCGSKNTTIGYSGQPARAVFAMCSACGASGPVQAFQRGMTFDWEECWNRRATPQADAAPIINGHAINDLFLNWSEWTTELGEAISRKNIDGFVSELRAAIAAGGAQEAVAWMYSSTRGVDLGRMRWSDDMKALGPDDMVETPLYAAPLPRVAATAWQPIETAPRDGANILIRFGSDGVSQAKYVSGTPHPWKFIDTNDGITWLINHAVDTEYGPTHWQPLPAASNGEQA